MNKLFFILLACFISVAMIPLCIAQTPDGETPAEETVCDGLEGAAFGLCNAYCEAQDCDEYPDSKSCETLRKNYAKITGSDIFPCEVACCFCSTGAQDPTGQGCEHTTEDECSVRGGLQIGGLGEYSCGEVGCTIESDDPGCDIVDNDPEDPIIPACINGISEVILPFPPFLPLCPFLGGELMDEPCPGVPLCEGF